MPVVASAVNSTVSPVHFSGEPVPITPIIEPNPNNPTGATPPLTTIPFPNPPQPGGQDDVFK